MKKTQNQQEDAALLYKVLSMVRDNDGAMHWNEIVRAVPERFSLPERMQSLTKSGYERWKAVLSFLSIDLGYAGYITRNNGSWIITDEGSASLEDDEWTWYEKLIAISRKYQDDRRSQQKDTADSDAAASVETTDSDDTATDLTLIREQADDGIRAYIAKLNPYEFQDLVAALFRALGYITPYIAPRGKDGGIDVIAYSDPIGAARPHIKIQVKHTPAATISAATVRELSGCLRSGDVGVVVTSGHFSPDAKKYARESHQNHINLIDFEQFLKLWTDNYPKLSDQDKALLPITPIYFINPN